MNISISNNWIRASVFFEKDHWQKIISDFFRPYILTNKGNGNIGSFYFSFSTEQGEHIRFAFECITTSRERFADDFDDQLNNYLTRNPSPQPAQNYIGRAFFMDYYNNSIQYNLYKLDVINNEVNELRCLISERILNVFALEAYDDTSMFSFCLYIIMAFCNTWAGFFNEDVNLKILSVLHKPGDEPLDIQFKPYADLFIENKEMLIAMYEEVTAGEKQHDAMMDPAPIKAWFTNMLSKHNNNDFFKQGICFLYDQVIINQTNINQDLIPSMYYLIHLCLEAPAANY